MTSNKEADKAKREEGIKERTKVRREKLAGYFFDISKLVFAALVLGGLSPLMTNNSESTNWQMIILGLFTTYILAYSANRILK